MDNLNIQVAGTLGVGLRRRVVYSFARGERVLGHVWQMPDTTYWLAVLLDETTPCLPQNNREDAINAAQAQ